MNDTIRDARDPGFYIVDNELIDVYGPTIGVYGVAVYNVLLKYANGAGESAFPSYQTIADALGMSRPKAISTVKELVNIGLVAKRERHAGTGEQTSNAYTIVSIKRGKRGLPGVVNDVNPGSKPHLPGVVNDVNPGSKCGLPDQDPINKTPLINTESEIVQRAQQLAAAENFDGPTPTHRTPSKPKQPTIKAGRYFDPRKLRDGYIPAGQGANAVEVYYERYAVANHKLSAPNQDDIVRVATNLDRWRAVVTAWSQAGYKPTNIAGMLDWYRDPGRMPGKATHENTSRTGTRNHQQSAEPAAVAAGEFDRYAKYGNGT